MSRAARGLALGVAAVVGLLVAAAFGIELLRGRLEESDVLRDSLERAVSAQLGGKLLTGPLRVEFWPVRLRLDEPVVDLPGGARLELAGVELRVDPGDLWDGVARLESASVLGPARLVSGDFELRGGLDAALRPDPGSGAWVVDAVLHLDDGGQVWADGAVDAGGVFRGEVRFEGVDAAPFAGFVRAEGPEPASIEGRFDGSLEPASETEGASLRLASEAALIHIPPLLLDGPVALVAQIPRISESRGLARFAIDASKARVEYAGGPIQASAEGASVEGNIVRTDDGTLRLEQVTLRVAGFRGKHRR